MKLKEVHVINVSPLVDTIVNFVKPFLKEKIRERIFLHSTMDGLYKYVAKDMLPVEYGGQAGSIKDINGKTFSFLSFKIMTEHFAFINRTMAWQAKGIHSMVQRSRSIQGRRNSSSRWLSFSR